MTSKKDLKMLIKKYAIQLSPNDANKVLLDVEHARCSKSEINADVAVVKDNKPEILAILREREAEKEAKKEEELAIARKRAQAIDSIHGLEGIRKASYELDEWRKAYNDSFEGDEVVGGLGVAPKPNYDISAMLKKYPQAAAYLKIEDAYLSQNVDIGIIGEKYRNMFADNLDAWETVVAEFDQAMDELTNRRLWD